MAAPAPGAPPTFSGIELIMAALNHPSPLARTQTTDSFGDTEWTWGSALWESEDLLRVSAVSKELRTAAAADHLWEPLLERFKEQHPFGKDGHGDSTHPAYPERVSGERRDRHTLLLHVQDSEACSHVPALVLSRSAVRHNIWSEEAYSRLNEDTGDVEDKFHPASEDPGTHWFVNMCPTTIWLKRPPVLWCQPCGGLSFECGRSFKEHCSGWKHRQLILPPEERLPKELWDPRWNPQDWAALTPLGRYQAIHLHVETVMATFNAPVDVAGMENMEDYAHAISEHVVLRGDISDEERDGAASYCTAEMVVVAIRAVLLIPEFNLHGLGIGDGRHAGKFFAGPPGVQLGQHDPRRQSNCNNLPAEVCRVRCDLRCVFDFNDVLKICGSVEERCKAPEGRAVIDACLANGYNIAIATSTCSYDFVTQFITALYGWPLDWYLAVFRLNFDLEHSSTHPVDSQPIQWIALYGWPLDRQFVNSGCFTYCEGQKEFSLDKIADCQGEPRDDTTFKCFVLFDDSWENMDATRKRNAHFVKVDPAVGVTMSDFEQGKATLSETCGAM
ncbi:hypothetical protein FOA52_002414 [Chlamydomonas sp. UWO 241]|nr:hypothetical protein FOA52_002414 [Chlamydomonas sp. UWO 241]